MSNLLKTVIIFIFTSALFFSFANFAWAGETGLTPPRLQINIPTLDLSEWTANNSGNWLGLYIKAIYQYAIGIVGILAAVVLMFGGLLWLTAGGNTGQVTEAKEWIKASLTGLILALSSYMILYVVNPDLTIFQPLNIPSIKSTGTNNATNNLTRSGDPLNLTGVTDNQSLTKAYEGLRLDPYTDSLGNLTIGYGHRLGIDESRDSITQEQAENLFNGDYTRAMQIAQSVSVRDYGTDFNTLTSAQQGVLTDMAFNMGRGGLNSFSRMFEAINQQNWVQAGAEIRDSTYAGQVGQRSNTNANIMASGQLP